MKAFYHLNAPRITIREYLFGTPWILLPVILFVKLFRISLSSSTDDPIVESVAPFEVGEAELPADVLERFQKAIVELSALGFHSPIYHVIKDPLRSTYIYWATFLHSTGHHIARIHNRVWIAPAKVKNHFFPIFCMPCQDGSFLVSSAGKPDLLSPASVSARYHIGMSIQKLWSLHESAVQKASVVPLSVSTQDQLRQTIEQWHILVRDFHIARGIFQPLKEDEIKRLDLTDELLKQEDISIDDAQVFANIYRIQQKKTNALSTLLLLAISLIVFVMVWRFSRLTGILLIVPILILHELGHYLTMRAFKYRNLNVFFIPLLGAAVSGQHYNVPGWKRAIVSLAGPVPGILIGTILGIVGAVLGIKPLLAPALMLLVINGFNLLPIMPLDGGWLFHTVLFSRHPYLDTAFRALAVFGLFLLGIGTGDKILTAICIPMAMALPTSWRQASIAYRLRKSGFNSDSADEATIPIETAKTILRLVREKQPKQQAPGLLAQQVLGIFQTLNTRPPKILASIGLLTAYLGALFIAFVVAGFLFLVSSGNMKDMLGMLEKGGKYEYRQGSTQQHIQSNYSAVPNAARTTIIAICKNDSEAGALYKEFSGKLPATASLRLFGQSLLLSLPEDAASDRKRLVKALEPKVKRILVDREGNRLSVSFTCLLSSKKMSKQCEQEFDGCFPYSDSEYLYLSTDSLVQPWTSAWKQLSPEQRSKFTCARITYYRLQNLYTEAYQTPDVKKAQQHITQLREKGDVEEASRLNKNITKTVRAEEERLLKDICSEATTDTSVVDLWKKIRDFDVKIDQVDASTAKKMLMTKATINSSPKDKQIKALIDQGNSITKMLEERLGARPNSKGNPENIKSGYARSEGRMVLVQIYSFSDISRGLPLIAEWLCQQGSVKVRYDINSLGSAD
ncbi:site-2 protease family protein [bacterium]|nr:site-2 protease family protein [bacterium]